MIIDTFPAFERYWAKANRWSLDQQIDGWAKFYQNAWPELFDKQVGDYRSAGLDWKQIARERVFPFLGERLPTMQSAHANLLDEWQGIFHRAQAVLGFDGDLLYVIHVGIGSGAGWATTYQGRPAILFGLENIAEEGWSERAVVSSLAAHEIGHVFHAERRRRHGLEAGAGPYWQLYEEGFAQRCEHLIQGKDTWHMAHGQGSPDDWLAWCQANRENLAGRFLELAEGGGDLRPFFGSWFDVGGWKQCGYYLGHEVVFQMEGEYSLEQIALVTDVDGEMKSRLIDLNH